MFSRKKYIQIESSDEAQAGASNVVRVVEASEPGKPHDKKAETKTKTVRPAAEPVHLDPTLVAYPISALIQVKNPEASAPALLLAGYGSALKEAVKAFKQAEAESVYVTGTADKERGFSFSGFAQVINMGDTFDARLFTNEYALIEAACTCGARYILVCGDTEPSDLLLRAADAKDIRILCPMPGDKSLSNWVVVVPRDDVHCTDEEIVWKKCPHCKLNHEASAVMEDGGTCPTCGELYRLTSEERIAYLFDPDTFEEWHTGLPETDPLGFPDYDSLLSGMRKKSDREEAVRCGKAQIAGMDVAICIMETTFMMGSMGSVVGEKITRTIERATALGLPLVIFTASGGARMQEGLVSLMQMAKTSAAIERHGRAGLPYFSVITDPTTGGVTASFATEGDLVIAEPHALIGFAGRRVIEDTIRQTLPEGFQTAEFALEHGLIDAIVERSDLRSFLAHALAIHMASVEERKNQANQQVEASEEDARSVMRTRMLEDLQNPGATRRIAAPAEGDVVDMKLYNYRMVEEALQSPQGSAFHQASHTMQQAQKGMPGIAGRAREGKSGGVFSGVKNFFGGAARLVTGKQTKRVFETEGSAIRRELSKRSVADAPGVMPLAGSDSTTSLDEVAGKNAAWESVLLARNVHRPTAKYYIDSMVDGFIELHGDRAFGDDGAILAGIGWIQGYPVTVIAEEKGEDLNQRIARNFGCPQPEGYRKSLRLMKQAEKFGRPIVCLVDTQGAYCGMEAEERGQGNAIAENLVALSGIEVPVISVVLGEGGSGGALALAVGNRVAMQKHAVYSVLSPEGFASILWKDRSRAAEAAAVMKMSADEACELGIIEEVLSEGAQPAHENPEVAAENVKDFVVRSLRELAPLGAEELRNQRYARFRKF